MSTSEPPDTGGRQGIVLGLTLAERAGAVVVIAAVGAVIGFLLPWILELLARLPWAPFSGPLRLLEELDDLLPVGPAVIGAVVGGALAFIGTARSATLTIEQSRLAVSVGGEEQVVPQESIAHVYRDGEAVVVLDVDGDELVRAEVDVKDRRLAEALESHGYPWRDADPRTR